MKNFLRKLYIWQNIYLKNKYFFNQESYSAFGEDVAIKKYFKNKINGFYVDVGCYHPIKANNTLLLYQKGWTGINIDINKLSIDLFKFCRPKDLNLNLAISRKKATMYYQKELSLLNSIKKKQAKSAFQGKILTKKIKSKSLNTVLNNSIFKNRRIDFLDIDVEGTDFEVLTSLNFKRYNPQIISVEIMPPNLDLSKIDIEGSNIYKFLIKKKYQLIWSNKFSVIFKKLIH